MLKKIASMIREDVLRISYNANIGHIGSALSVVDILVALYFAVMNVKPKNPEWEDGDRFILSKGHAAAALDSVLFRKGYFTEDVLNTYCQDGAKLLVHPEWNGIPGIEAGTGSLGHGLPVGVGMAYGAKLLGKKYRVFVLISDAELNEGSVWEAALFAAHHDLGNLTVIVDYNGSQALGETKKILNLEPVVGKWKAFNFDTGVVNGHNLIDLVKELKKNSKNKPKVVIAKTVMGKGVRFMENNFHWHYLNLSNDQFKSALEGLEKK